jgi:hypothetical protein
VAAIGKLKKSRFHTASVNLRHRSMVQRIPLVSTLPPLKARLPCGSWAPLPVVGVGTKRAKSFRHPARGGAAASRKRGPDLAGFASKVFELNRAFGQEL